MSWIVFALMSAGFAALTTVLAKIGIKRIDSNVATAIRTVVILLLAWGIVVFQGNVKTLGEISKNSWLFLILSGLATGLSWLCYFKALQLGKIGPVVAIDKLSMMFAFFMGIFLLGEKTTTWGYVGIGLMTVGAMVVGILG